MGTAKAKGVKITNPNWIESPSRYRGRLSLAGRYATLHRRCEDDSVIEVKLLYVGEYEPEDGLLIVRKKALVPVTDKELFQARLKGL
jgi:hypothetical protein